MDLRRGAMIVVQALLMLGVRASEIRSYPLDERSVYTIRLGKDEPTTVVFPAAIKAIVGANVSAKAEDEPAILLWHEPGTDYFSLRPAKDGAAGALNIMMRGRVYALALVTNGAPDRAVVFLDEAMAGGKPREADWRMLVERAKQVQRGTPQLGGMAAHFEQGWPGSATHYRGFTATIEFVVRFEAEDALVFRIRLENRRDAAVTYDPQALALRLGHEIFPAIFAEASGGIPATGSSLIHLVIAGAQEGGRANLPVHAAYSVIVPPS